MKKIGSGSTSSGTVIVEMTDAEFMRLEKSPVAAAGPEKPMTHNEWVAYVRERLRKLKPKTKEAAVHPIEAMFQFRGGITDAETERVLTSLQKEKFLRLDGQSRLTFLNK